MKYVGQMKIARKIVCKLAIRSDVIHAHSPWTALTWNKDVPNPLYSAPAVSACAGPKLGKRSNAYCAAVDVMFWFTKIVPSNVFVTESRAFCN